MFLDMEHSFKNRIIIFLVIAGVLIGANFVFADQIKNFSYSQSFGFQRTVWQMASALTFTNQNQSEVNKNLAEENQKLLSALAELETTKEENKFLKNALNVGLEKEHKLIEAEAFGGGRFNGKDFSYEDSVLINKGKNDGIQKGFPVVVSGKVLIGKISEVYDNFSRIALITDKSSLIDIQIINSAKMEDLVATDVAEKTTAESEQNSNNNTDQKPKQETNTSEKIIAIAKGDSGFKMSLDMFPKDKDLDNDAIVMTSSLSGNYPAGYVVGRIKDPKKIDTETFKQAEIIPAFNPSLLDKVFILKDIEIVKND